MYKRQDLDSIISALTYSYFSYINDPLKPFFPVINISKEDLNLRRDVCYVLESQKLSPDLLYFKEDLKSWKNQFDCSVDCVLVDQNDIPSSSKELITNVVGIIDHHTDLGLHHDSIKTNSGPRIVQVAGSCSSLIYSYWSNRLKDKDLDCLGNAAPLLLSALLIDTDNMKNKVEMVDVECFREYKRLMATDVEITSFFQSLRDSKDNIEGLSLFDVLIKDYKQFEFAQRFNCGIGSVVKSLEWLQENFTKEEFEDACISLIKKLKLDALLVMTSFTYKGEFCKEIAFISNSIQNTEILNHLTDNLATKLNLSPLPLLSSEKMKCYTQGNVKASRKQVVPLIQEFFTE